MLRGNPEQTTPYLGFAVGCKGTDGILHVPMRRITGLFSARQAENVLPVAEVRMIGPSLDMP
jgi:hypothetical protein